MYTNSIEDYGNLITNRQRGRWERDKYDRRQQTDIKTTLSYRMAVVIKYSKCEKGKHGHWIF